MSGYWFLSGIKARTLFSKSALVNSRMMAVLIKEMTKMEVMIDLTYRDNLSMPT